MNTNTYLMMFSTRDLIALGIILVIVILPLLIAIAVFSGRKEKTIKTLEEDGDMYCDLYYTQVLKMAEAKYKAYATKGYLQKLPSPLDAISKERDMQNMLERAESETKRKVIWEENLPTIMLALVRCRAEGIETIPKKEAAQIRRLMKEYGITRNQ